MHMTEKESEMKMQQRVGNVHLLTLTYAGCWVTWEEGHITSIEEVHASSFSVA